MVELRNFTIGDAETLRQLHYKNMSEEDIGNMISDWNKFEFNGKYFEMFAVVVDDKIVGELSLYEHSESVISIGLEIFGEFQRRGYGKQAVISALRILKSKKYKIVCNRVLKENAPSVALHKNLGFESDMYCYKNQKEQEVYLFFKAID